MMNEMIRNTMNVEHIVDYTLENGWFFNFLLKNSVLDL